MTRPSNESEQTRAYDRMMERVKSTLEQTERDALPPLQRSIEQAKITAVELGELTRDEAEQIGDWLRRDLQDAGDYLARTGRDLAQQDQGVRGIVCGSMVCYHNIHADRSYSTAVARRAKTCARPELAADTATR